MTAHRNHKALIKRTQKAFMVKQNAISLVL